MGLDMYLRAEKNLYGYDFYGPERKAEYTALIEYLGVADFADSETPSANIGFTVAYWRKANHIHRWFVDYVQGGVDECRPHYVSREQLTELRAVCDQILQLKTTTAKTTITVFDGQGAPKEEVRKGPALTGNAKAAAEELLPTQSGFFFGGTEYDEWYLRDVEYTFQRISQVLKLGEEWSFEYQSSW